MREVIAGVAARYELLKDTEVAGTLRFVGLMDNVTLSSSMLADDPGGSYDLAVDTLLALGRSRPSGFAMRGLALLTLTRSSTR